MSHLQFYHTINCRCDICLSVQWHHHDYMQYTHTAAGTHKFTQHAQKLVLTPRSAAGTHTLSMMADDDRSQARRRWLIVSCEWSLAEHLLSVQLYMFHTCTHYKFQCLEIISHLHVKMCSWRSVWVVFGCARLEQHSDVITHQTRNLTKMHSKKNVNFLSSATQVSINLIMSINSYKLTDQDFWKK